MTENNLRTETTAEELYRMQMEAAKAKYEALCRKLAQMKHRSKATDPR